MGCGPDAVATDAKATKGSVPLTADLVAALASMTAGDGDKAPGAAALARAAAAAVSTTATPPAGASLFCFSIVRSLVQGEPLV